MTATAWDANFKSAGIALTTFGGVLLDASITSGNSNVAATRPLSGKTYFEVKAQNKPTTVAVGLCNRAISMSSGTLLGGDANGLGFRDNGTVLLNNSTLTTIQSYANGDTVCVAVDPAGRLIWFRTNGGNWNNSGTADPATGAEGIDLSTMAFGTLYPACGGVFSATPNNEWLATFTSGFAQTPPSGFITIDTMQAVGRSGFKTPAGAWYGISKNTPGTRTRFWSPAAAETDVSGVVTAAGSPIATRVRLYDQATGELLGETTSSAVDGSYSIPALGRAKVMAIAIDAPFGAEIFDNITPL